MRRRFFLIFALLFSIPALAEPKLAFTDVTSGAPHRLADYRGQWIVVNYWATWCPPCLEEIPELVHFHETHKGSDAVVLGINMEQLEREVLVRFVEENFVTYPVGARTSEAQVIGPIPGLPTTYLISPEGRLVARQVGPVTSESLEAFISDYAKQASR